MLKYIASTLKIKKGLSLIYTYSQEGKYEAYRSKILPQTYNVNISLISNMSKIRDFPQFFQLVGVMQPYLREKHLAHAMRLLMRLVESSQRKSGRMQRKEAYEINLEDRERWESWRVFLLKIMETDFAYVSKDQLLDHLHFVYKSFQFRIYYNKIFFVHIHLYLKYRASLIQAITRQETLSQLSIPQLVSLLHNLIVLKQVLSSITAILDQLQHQLTFKPFCTCFHLILLNNHLKTLQVTSYFEIRRLVKKRVEQNKIAQLRTVMRGVLEEQITTVLPYIDLVTVIQVYNMIGGGNPALAPLLLARIRELLGQPKQEHSKNSFAAVEVNLFLTALKYKEKEGLEIIQLRTALARYFGVEEKGV